MKLIRGGEHFSIVLSQDGFLYSFGRCDQSQLGISLEQPEYKTKRGAGAFIRTPQLVLGKNDELKSKTIVDVTCGSTHTLFTTSDGECYSFGFGEENQLGHGKAKDEAYPRKIENIYEGKQTVPLGTLKVKGMSCGGQHSLILLSN